ncbi:DUF6166 domain-containing protein (plasmid) [Halococcus dombrowskii]|jgi:hypothetical protein|uniref:DUF6166 domain-containing protein n=2 Tax=Halococcus dombrowskii TaxID=179637 RepID=A0AAX3ATV7_HALDO|nr:DUF6166 domain-containing protein [Halococcus dombrowskii]UOO97168.1 DUF6166 domain-containing protein [Halococcus dombrowskii]
MASMQVSDDARDRLSELKEELGMTYDGVVKYLLRLEEENRTAENKPEGLAEAPDPKSWYREGARGAQEYVLAILKSEISQPKEYKSSAKSAVWKTYHEEGVEHELTERAAGTVPPTIDDLIEMLSKMLQNPVEYSISGSESEIELLNHDRTRILRALAAYRETINDDETSLESQEAPDLAVPADRTYRGGQHNGENIVTAGDDDLDVRSDLSGVNTVSWGYAGSGPRALAVAILADAYSSDRYAQARGSDLYDSYTSKLSTGKSWEIQADELEQYVDDK